MKPTNRFQEKKYDLVVVGGGMSGVCAALAAARNGAKTAIVHARPVFGGAASSETRVQIQGASYHDLKKNVNESGILLELLLENKNRNPYHDYCIWDTVLWEKLKYQENLDIYLNTSMDDIETEGNRITKIVCNQSTTEMTYIFSADVFLDATGNGTVGYFAGAEYRIGSESKSEFGEPNAPDVPNRHVMGNTIYFSAEDKGEPSNYQKPSWAYSFTEQDLFGRKHGQDLPDTLDLCYWWNEISGREEDIVAESEEIRDDLYKSAYGIWDHVKNSGEHGAQNYSLSWVSAVPGMRESRRLVGDYLLNENDVWNSTVFSDAVAYGGWPMDEHIPYGIFRKNSADRPTRYFHFDGVYTIPYRCFYSKNIQNLLFAGRDISTSRMAFGSTRVMATCAIGGQAAGTAAALAVKYNCTPREVLSRIEELQQTLLKDDCYIPGFHNTDSADLALQAQVTASSTMPRCEPENVINGISRKVKNSENCWESNGISKTGEILQLSLSKRTIIKQIRITFDSNLSKELMPTMVKHWQDLQNKSVPDELVRDYVLEIFDNKQCVFQKSIDDNYQRLNILELPEELCGDTIRITAKKTHGYQNIRIFEVRVY